MPVFKFSSPEGVDYYGEGENAYEAFRTAEERSPNEIAAMRMRQSVMPAGGRGESEFTETVENMLVPGLGPARAIGRGDYESAAEQTALTAMPAARFLPPAVKKAAVAGAGGLFGATAGESIGAESMFAAETDPVRRKAWEKQYREATPKGQREILRDFNAEQSKIQGERREQERLVGAQQAEARRREDWLRENAESIKSLKPAWQQEIAAAAGLPEAQTAFGRGMEERRKASETIAEAHPEVVGALEVAGMVLGGYLPGKFASRRANLLEKSVGEAEEAYEAGRKTVKLREASDAAEKNLEKMIKLHQLGAGEIAGSVFLPWGFGQAPNFYDMIIGQLSSDPGAQEKVDRAWNNVLSLGPLERAMIEGTVATGIGTLFGASRKDFGAIKATGEGLLESFGARRTKEAEAAQRRTSLAEKKRADAAKSVADQLEAQRNLAAAMQAQKRPTRKKDPLKSGGPLASDDDVLSK